MSERIKTLGKRSATKPAARPRNLGTLVSIQYDANGIEVARFYRSKPKPAKRKAVR